MLQKGNKKKKNHSVYIKILHLTNAKFLIITHQTTTIDNKKKNSYYQQIKRLFSCIFQIFCVSLHVIKTTTLK